MDAENVGGLAPDAGDEALAVAGFLGVINVGSDDLEGGSVGDFSKSKLLPEVGGGERASKSGLRDGIRPCGDPERTRDDGIGGGSVVGRARRVSVGLGVLTVCGRGASRSGEGLVACVDVTFSICCMYRLSAIDEVPIRG